MDDAIQKFVDTMRASGQPDDMIAESLISAGHSEIMVLNALGVSDMEELYESMHEDEEDSQPAQPFEVPSAYQVTDAEGNMLISPDNMPKAIGEDATPTPVTQPKPGMRVAPRQPSPRTPRRAVSRPPARRISDMPTKKTEAPQQQPAMEFVAKPNPALEPEQKDPTQTNLDTPHKTAEPQKKYGHHTFDDFMGRIKGHKELEAGTDDLLEEHYTDEQPSHNPPQQHREMDVPKPLAKHPFPKPQAPQQPEEEEENIDKLLEAQKEEATAAPSGPQMDDLLDKKDLDDLEKEVGPEKKAPSAVDLKKAQATEMSQPSSAVQVSRNIEDAKNSLALKIVVILIGVLVLIGLTASIISRVQG